MSTDTNAPDNRKTPAGLSLEHVLCLVLPATGEGQRVNTRSQSGEWVIGELDPVGQVGREKHQGLLGCVAVGIHGGDADRGKINRLAIVGQTSEGSLVESPALSSWTIMR